MPAVVEVRDILDRIDDDLHRYGGDAQHSYIANLRRELVMLRGQIDSGRYAEDYLTMAAADLARRVAAYPGDSSRWDRWTDAPLS